MFFPHVFSIEKPHQSLENPSALDFRFSQGLLDDDVFFFETSDRLGFPKSPKDRMCFAQ